MTNAKLSAALLAAAVTGGTIGAIASDSRNDTPEVEACRALIAKADAPKVIEAEDVPDIVDSVPPHAGKLMRCEPQLADIDPGTPSARKATMRCDREVNGEIVPQWLGESDAAKVKDAKEVAAAKKPKDEAPKKDKDKP